MTKCRKFAKCTGYVRDDFDKFHCNGHKILCDQIENYDQCLGSSAQVQTFYISM